MTALLVAFSYWVDMVAAVMSVLMVSALGLALLAGAVADASLASRAAVLGVDAGTESLRAVLFDKDGGIISSAACEYASGTQFPRNGW